MKAFALGLTFGAFDPFHYGHLYLFREIKAQCDKLAVCVSTDEYIRQHKSREPFSSFAERLGLIMELKTVDAVSIQSDAFDKRANVQAFKPDAIFVGSDWTPQTFTGEGLGVPVVYIPRLPQYSSTALRGSA